MKDLELNSTGYNILCKPWSSLKAIMAEFSQDENLLKRALKEGHGIEIDESIPGHDPMIYIVVDAQMRDKLKQYRIENPTMLQIIGTSRVLALTKQDAENKFHALMTA